MGRITDASILFDLEYRGIQSFIADMECGLKVPTVLVERVKDIVRNHYVIILEETAVSDEIVTGHFCLIPFTSTMTTLTKTNHTR